MKRICLIIFSLIMVFLLASCDSKEVKMDSQSDNHTPSVIQIGEKFGTDSVECSIDEVKWITELDVLPLPRDKYGSVGADVLCPGYNFRGMSGFNDTTSGYPYLSVKFTLKNVGKTLIEPLRNENELIGYGSIAVVYDDGYTFESDTALMTELEVLGDAFCEGRLIELPNEVMTNDEKPLYIKMTLPNSSGEVEEFMITAR